MALIYIDTSAFLRAFLAGSPEHDAAYSLVTDSSFRLISSELLWLEADRAVIRLASEFPAVQGLAAQVNTALRGVNMIDLDRRVLNAARAIPDVVKSLDAIHIASVEVLGSELDCVVTYDKTMVAVLTAHGLTVHTAAEALACLSQQ